VSVSSQHRTVLPAGWTVQWSDRIDDPSWEEFLLNSIRGQFQQSSAWAESKGTPWSVTRVVWSDAGRCRGGFQLLHRPSRFGRIGYVSKGPVLAEESSEDCLAAVGFLQEAARRLELRALVVQAPDPSNELPPALLAGGFQREHLLRVNEHTLKIDLTPGVEGLQQGLRARTRAEVRQAQRRGVTIREGGEADLPLFFELMVGSCRRQNAQPNPSSAGALARLYRAHQRRQQVRLTFAQAEGKVLGGGLYLLFGRCATFWKKGWSSEGARLHPMTLLNWEGIEWAARQGFEAFDFAAMSREVAETLLQGGSLLPEMYRTRDIFNLGFGGRPLRCAPSCVYLPHPTFRFAWWVLNSSGVFRRIARRLAAVAD
jgi:peptidoglycan pentaglycine glycine transferase (the first glycine)